MGRLPDELVERLKKEVSIQRLVEARGVKLKRTGKNLMGLCPFHDDHNPSLSVTPSTNKWNCLGCGKGGTVIDWVMHTEGVSFRHAAELLQADYLPAPVRPGAEPPRFGTVAKLPPPITRTADDQALLLEVVAYYNQTLKRVPEALKYLASRGLHSSEMIDHFRLGFGNRTLCYRLPQKNRQTGAELRGRLQHAGIMRQSGHEHFNGSMVIPIIDAKGQVAQMYGRKISTNLREGTDYHLYLPGPLRGVWNEPALAVSKEIILCEALIDALTFWCAGFRQVTTSYGVNGFTDDHRAAFKKYGTRRIFIAYDHDEAGDKAAAKHAEELIEMGIECFRVQFPKGMDANEFALKVTPAAKSLGMLLTRAEWLGKGKRPVAVSIAPPAPPPADIEEAPESVPEIEEPAEPGAEIGDEAQAPEPASDGQPEPEPEPEPTSEPQPEPEKPEPAAKEKIAIETPEPSSSEENIFPLAAEPEPALITRPLPSAMPLSKELIPTIKGEDIFFRAGDREYRIRGLAKNTSTEIMRVNVRVQGANLRGEVVLHVDTFDMNSARHRMAFAKQAADELGVKEDLLRQELARAWSGLEVLQQELIEKTLQKPEEEIQMTAAERAAALKLLRDPRLKERILADFQRCGVVGEEKNKLIGYFAAVSRHLDAPLAVMVQSSSAAGKSSLMDAVLALMPEEHRVQYSAMTGQSLFYMGETDLKNKILAIAEEEGAQRASYALKLLQSEGVLTIASTGKDPNSGRLITHEYKVEGPVMIFLTTTAIDMDDELLNRCMVLAVNEDREQTQAIHKMQREAQTLEGLFKKRERADIRNLHRNAQRLLRRIAVVNERAPELTFPDSMTRSRRDHMKYLTLIQAITLMHQHQRQVKTQTRNGTTLEYIEATDDDIKLAQELITEVLGRSLDDLRPQTRRLLLLIDEMVTEASQRQNIERGEFRFSRREVREYTHWGDTQLKLHLHRLEELEYLIVHRGGRGQSFVYELFFERQAEPSKRVLPWLYNYDLKKSGSEGEKSGASRPQVGPLSGGCRVAESPITTPRNGDFSEKRENNTVRAGENQDQNRIVPIKKKAAGGN
jgi:DNA primase catalytic core